MTGKRQFSAANRKYVLRLFAHHGSHETIRFVMSLWKEELIREVKSLNKFGKIMEAMKLAQRFEGATKCAREAGSKKPSYDAALAIYLETVEDAEQKLKTASNHFEKWRETTKKKVQSGRRYLMAMQRNQLIPAILSAVSDFQVEMKHLERLERIRASLGRLVRRRRQGK